MTENQRLEEEEAQAWITFGEQPENVRAAQHLVAVLLDREKPLPDHIHERALRLQLREKPFDGALTYSLVALLCRLDEPPLPGPPPLEPDVAAPTDTAELATLAGQADALAEAGDTFGIYAILWQAIVRHPQAVRPWAELARHFAERHEWANCRIAARYVTRDPRPPDRATATALIATLSILAERRQLGELAWEAWISRLPETLACHPDALKLLYLIGRIQQASLLLPRLVTNWPEHPAAWLMAGRIAFEREELADGYTYMRRAIELNPSDALHEIVRSHSIQFVEMVRFAGKTDELAEWLTEAAGSHHELNLVPSFPGREARQAARRLRASAMNRGLPSALLIAQAKSASVTVGNIFSSGFHLPTVLYSIVTLRVISPWLQDFLLGGGCYTTHLLPTPRNIELLRAGGVRSVIVHVRDPRQLAISWMEHLRRYPREALPSVRHIVEDGGPEAVAFALEAFLPGAIAWIDGWVRAREQLTVHFTTFEDFVANQETFIDRLLEAYGGDTRFFDRTAAIDTPAGTDFHRRLGAIDEWRGRLTPHQTDRANGMIPDHLWDLFGWKP